MGLFGGEEIFVSSVVYNMAGDLEGRPDFLKTTVASNVINHSNFGMAETLSSAYLHGPGINIRSWHRWCKYGTHYNQVGVPYSRVADESDLTPYAMADEIESGTGVVAPYYVSVSTTYYGPFDYYRFAQQYMVNNAYAIYGTAWTAAYNPTTNQITITKADSSTIVFTPAGYNPATDGEAKYLYSFYNIYEDATPDVWQATKKYIYKIGSGNTTLDELITITSDTSDEFLAIIPLRFKGQFISGTYKPDVYAQTTRAYKKLTGGQKLSKLIEKVADNEDIDDIDHAFIMHGVNVNTQEPKSKLYLAHFFERMQGFDPTSWAAYELRDEVYADYQADYAAWRESRATWNDEHPGEPFPPPPVMPAVVTPTTKITISSKIGTDNTDLCDISLKWRATRKTTGTGLGKPGALPQDVWWDPVTINAYDEEVATLWWQTSATTWVKYEIIGLHFINEIYKGESFKLGIKDALEDEDESPFIVPIHYDTLKSMPLVWSTQVMCSATWIVFNCYEVVKQKWYQTGIFKIVVFVVMIAITVATGGAGAIGLLGTAGSVGASLGFTGLMATIVGAVANALAAMILMAIISKFSVAVFGAKLGAIIATVASVMAMSVGAGMMSGQSLAASWGNLMSASNILGMTSSVGNGIAGYMQAGAMEWMEKSEQLMSEYEKASAAIRKQYIEEFGLGKFAFDPLGLTNVAGVGADTVGETPRMFLDRTLMTGSDVADMSLDMLSNFANYTLDVNTIAS